ncbi:MAG: hypothetical protein GKR89_05715 [Candidatus Latescibacteria bacterium]|nr:hypothetical protein [Candidatus Latescibacterota bacterium]
MESTIWKEIWFYIFFVAVGLFYLVVAVVAVRGAGDLREMIDNMLHGDRNANG